MGKVDFMEVNPHTQMSGSELLRVMEIAVANDNGGKQGLDAMVQSIAEHLKSLPADERQRRIKAFVSRRPSKPRLASKTQTPENETFRSLKISQGRKQAHP